MYVLDNKLYRKGHELLSQNVKCFVVVVVVVVVVARSDFYRETATKQRTAHKKQMM